MPSRWGASTVLKGRLLKEQPVSHHTTAASTLAREQTGACGSVSLGSAHAVRRERERERTIERERKKAERKWRLFLRAAP